MQATDFIHDPGVDHLTAAMHKACAGKQLRVGGMGRLMFAAWKRKRRDFLEWLSRRYK